MTKKQPRKDRHLSRRIVRLGDALHAALRKAAEQNRREITEEIRAILIPDLRRRGFWPPPVE